MDDKKEQEPGQSTEKPVETPSTETSKGPTSDEQAGNASASEESSESKEVGAGQ